MAEKTDRFEVQRSTSNVLPGSPYGQRSTFKPEPYGSTAGPAPYGAGAGVPKWSEQTACRFCRRGIKYIDYKDIETLQKLLTNRGKIYSRKRSGNCAKCQRKAKKAIKRARYMALLPYTA